MMRGPRSFAVGCVSAAVCCALAVPLAAAQAQAQAGAAPRYRMIWNLLPQGVPGETRTVRSREIALTLPLVPTGLFVARADVRDPSGRVWAPAETQFVEVSSVPRIACTIHQMQRRGAEQLMFVGSLMRVCLVDSDLDDRFESRFRRSTNKMAFFLMRGRLSNPGDPIEPAGLERVDPTEIRDAPAIRVRLAGSTRPGGRIRLSATVGKERNGFPLAFGASARVADGPVLFDLYGGRMEVTPRADGAFDVRTLAPFWGHGFDFWD